MAVYLCPFAKREHSSDSQSIKMSGGSAVLEQFPVSEHGYQKPLFCPS